MNVLHAVDAFFCCVAVKDDVCTGTPSLKRDQEIMNLYLF